MHNIRGLEFGFVTESVAKLRADAQKAKTICLARPNLREIDFLKVQREVDRWNKTTATSISLLVFGAHRIPIPFSGKKS